MSANRVLRGVLWIGLLTVAAPVWSAPTTAWANRRGDVLALDNGRCRLELSALTGEVLSLRPGPETLRGSWFEVVEEDREGMAPWETWKHGAETPFGGGSAQTRVEVRGGVALARLRWARPSGLRYTAEVVLAPREAGPKVRLTVRNETGAALVDTLRLPLLRGVELGEPDDDWFTWPHTLGATFRVRGFKPGDTLEMPYPEFLYMQWLDLYQANQGLYVGCLDDYGYSKNLLIGRTPDGASLMGIVFTGCWVARAGDQWTTPWVQIAGHAGDWRSGADLYRPFAEKAFGPLDPPERVREMPTAQCWLAHHASDGDLGKLFEVQQQAPIHASYLMKSLNTSTPEGWDGFRGSALEYQRAFDRIRELGGSPALFTFDRAPLMGRPNYADYAGHWICQRRDGSFAEGFRDMMPSPFDADLVRARVGEAVRWVHDFGLDEIHFDTAATTGPSLAGPSYEPHHPQRPNEVPHYFKALYRAIRDACRRENPEFLLRAEHCADFFFPEFLTSTAHFFEAGNYVAARNAGAGLPASDTANARLLPILLRYTLPRHAALQMPSMSDDDFWTYGCGMGHGFHGGGPSWCFNPEVRSPEAPDGELLHRYQFCEAQWRRYYDFRVGFEEEVVDGRSDELAQRQVGESWQGCSYPGPLVAVTHWSARREVTLGQWYPLSHTGYFGERFVGPDRPASHPVRLRVPTKLQHPWARLLDARGVSPVRPVIANGMVECEVPDPTCFALEVAEGPALTLNLPRLAEPGKTIELTVEVEQPTPREGLLEFSLPAGWPKQTPIRVLDTPLFTARVKVAVPAGIFGRNYPIKVRLRSGDLTRTTAGHLLVMEPLTVVYSFDALRGDQPAGLSAAIPGAPARLTVTCINNTQRPLDLSVAAHGPGLDGDTTGRVEAADLANLGEREGPVRRWIEGQGPPPGNVFVRTFDYVWEGVGDPCHLRVAADGEVLFDAHPVPRTRLMDLNGDWKLRLIQAGQAIVGGVEANDNLDMDAVTPAVWDGGWASLRTPIRLDKDARRGKSWGIYRRLVYVPAHWQGADIWLRLGNTGAPWGEGGTLNLVYANGWPCGRVGMRGECLVSPFLVFGGWNLLAVASAWPNCLVEPYLFARQGPDPARLQPAEATESPAGAFLLMGQRCTGQGLTLPFIAGVPEGDYRRTNVAAGGENVFIYFAIADDYLREPEGPVEVIVEYLDLGTAQFGLDYDSRDPAAPVNGAFKGAPLARRTDSGRWLTHTFVLADARLANREHQGADFRLVAQEDDLCVRRVEVRSTSR